MGTRNGEINQHNCRTFLKGVCVIITIGGVIGAIYLHSTMNTYLGYLAVMPFLFYTIFAYLKEVYEGSSLYKWLNSIPIIDVKKIGSARNSELTPEKIFKMYLKYKRLFQKSNSINMDAIEGGRDVSVEGGRDVYVLLQLLRLACSRNHLEALFIQGCVFQSGFGSCNPDEDKAMRFFKDVILSLQNELAEKKSLSKEQRKLLDMTAQRCLALEKEQNRRKVFLSQHLDFRDSINKLNSFGAIKQRIETTMSNSRRGINL